MRPRASAWTRVLQGAVVLSVAVAIGWTALHARSAETRSTLYIALGELRSRAAEVQDVAAAAARGQVTDNFVRAQASQLVARIASVRSELAKRQSERDASTAAAARPLAERLLVLTEALAADGESASSPSLREGLAAIVTALIPLERRVRPT